MAFKNSVQALNSGWMQPTYYGSQTGIAITGTGATSTTIAVNGTTATSGTNYATRGLLRAKVYSTSGTTPTFQVAAYNNSSTTGACLFYGPAVNLQDLTVPVQVDTDIQNVILVVTAGGTSPTGFVDFEISLTE